MELSYYLFVTYIFVLVCAVLLIAKLMFADVKRQKKLLDEEETKLLKTFQAIESMMEEFYDELEDSRSKLEGELKVLEGRVTEAIEEPKEEPSAQLPPVPLTIIPPQHINIQLPEDKGPMSSFEQLINEYAAEPEPLTSSAFAENVLKLLDRGNSRAEIARELKVTQNEVDLVIGLSKTRK